MNAYDLSQHLRPFYVLQYWKDEKAKEEYSTVILSACGWMMADRFGKVVAELVKEWKMAHPPKPPHFIAVYNKLADKFRWVAPVSKCPSCLDGKVYVWVRHRKTGEEFRAMRPCFKCSHGEDIALKEELEEIDAPDSPAGLDWAKVTPGAARWMLTVIEGAPQRNVPAEWVQRLVTLAAQPSAERLPIERVVPIPANDPVRKNKLVRAVLEAEVPAGPPAAPEARSPGAETPAGEPDAGYGEEPCFG